MITSLLGNQTCKLAGANSSNAPLKEIIKGHGGCLETISNATAAGTSQAIVSSYL